MLNKPLSLKEKTNLSLLLTITFVQSRKHLNLVKLFNFYFINN